MNRNRYRLVFNTTLGMMVPVAETARRCGKSGAGKVASTSALALAGVLLGSPAWAELPVASANYAAPGTTANYHTNGAMQAYMNQVGNKAIVNFDSFNISAGHDVQLRQVHQLPAGFNDPAALVQGAQFTTLARIHDLNPSIIIGSISQAAGQQANLILVNSNGIAFMGGSQVNLNSFTASTLDIQDRFIDTFLPQGESSAQFENALDGSAARGFIKVFEGAKISAGQFGRVMLIAPTVVNKGKVTATDGQVIVAAASRVFLRSAGGQDANVRGLLVQVDSPAALGDFDAPNPTIRDVEFDGKTVALADATVDKLGHVTNQGELSTPRGNVTMIGYAVNQQGVARATTSVVANGSVYLLARDREVVNPPADRGGRVILASGSLTEVLPEKDDPTGAQDGATGAGLALRSQVLVLGQQIEMHGGATIHAPSGAVKFLAQDKPSELETGPNSPFPAGRVSATSRIHIADGARIDVAGLTDVQVSTARNTVEINLRSDELKDSPINQQGPLRGENVHIDLNRALADADAGKPTLVARDTLEANLANLQRTVAERSTTGGTVIVKSQGEARLDAGALIDLSGGSVQLTPANVKTTLLTSNGKTVDISEANAETRYDGIATKFVIDYGRWNRQKVIDLGQSYRYDPGYLEGRDAGSLNVVGFRSVTMLAEVAGRTITGTLQRESGQQPRGAGLALGLLDSPGIDDPLDENSRGTGGVFNLDQKIVIGATTLDDVNTLALPTHLFGQDKIAHLKAFTSQAAEVRDTLRLPQGGSVSITSASQIDVNADITAASGTIEFTTESNNAATTTVVQPTLDVRVAEGVRLSTAGTWVNDLPTSTGRLQQPLALHGGSITLAAGKQIDLAAGSTLDVGGGARLRTDGTVQAGNGGQVTLDGQTVVLGGEVRGYALGKGSTYTLKASRIRIGGETDPGTVNLDPAFFEQGGFARYTLNSIERLDIADAATLRPGLQNLELQPGFTLRPTGSDIGDFSRIVVRDDRVRQAVYVSFTSTSSDPAQGQIRLGDNARILADDQASISFAASNRIDLLGEVQAAGGRITASLNRGESALFDPASAIWLGQQATLDVAGVARTYVDNRGLTQGTVLASGNVVLNANGAYVVTEAGSQIKLAGAVPVRLDVPNETGGLGRQVGSDAGSLTVASTEGAVLDGSIDARAGGAHYRGGAVDLALTQRSSTQTLTGTFPTNARVLSLTGGIAPQPGSLNPGDAIPDTANGNSRIDTAALEAAGFEQMRFASADTIRLENNLNLGAGRSLPLRQLSLEAPRIETSGGDAGLTAHALRFANTGTVLSAAAETGSGTLTATAQQIEFVGNVTLSGMAQARFNGEQAIRFSATSATSRQAALRTAADLVFHGALVAPTTAAQAIIDATGRSVLFSSNGVTPVQPYSAFGSLTVKAQDIVQGGNLWAPLGQLNFEASGTLVFRDGSLTSVAADAGSLLPVGRVENGRRYVYGPEGSSFTLDDLPQKVIRTDAPVIDMQAGAQINLAGGGDVQAYEFTAGPGGSRDILTDANVYAVVPTYRNGFAPTDLQEGFDRAPGEAVFLSGVRGLADGVYTLLPAHYALLPGAYAVRLGPVGSGAAGSGTVFPGQAYDRQDGIRVAAGYVTDTRVPTGQAVVPGTIQWQGIEVLTHEQVRARSEFTLTRASGFFADSRNRPQDAGLLSINTTGSGAEALKLDALYSLAAGQGGRGAQVDISALNLALVSGTPTDIDPSAVVLDVDTLNGLGAASLLLGATRSSQGDTTTLDVQATTVTLDNAAGSALKASEVMLAATDTVTLKAGSAIDAQGAGGDAGHYETAGSGAFVRAGATTATFARSGNPGNLTGTLVGEAGSRITAADSITLDATRANEFKGTTTFARNGVAVAGKLAVGATRINFGDAPTGSGSAGLTYTQADLDAIDLASLSLISYSTFNLYGNVVVGQLDAAGKPVLQNLRLQGAGLAGIANAGQTAQLNAKNLTLINPNNAATFTAGGTLGSGTLAVTADTLTLGQGDKAIQGFNAVSVTANELVAATGSGKLDVNAPLTLNVARISGEQGSDQSLTSSDVLRVAQHTADRALAPVTALGAQWAFQGTAIDFDSRLELPSGNARFTATNGDVTLGANARVDVAGREVAFFDVKKPSWGGTAEFVSASDDVVFDAAAEVDVSAAAGGDAGTFIVRAADGSFRVQSGSVQGQSPEAAGVRGEGARALIDVKTLDHAATPEIETFSSLNTALNSGGFDGARELLVRTGDVVIASTDTVRAQDIRIAADSGKLDVAGTLDASSKDAGRIELFAKSDVNVQTTAMLKAVSSGAGEDGGDIEIGTRDGQLTLAAGSSFDVSGGAGGQGGTILLRTLRTAGNDDVQINGVLASSGFATARSVAVEAVKVYEGIDTLNAIGSSSGSTLTLETINDDNTAFASSHSTIKSDLGSVASADNFHVLSGVEVRSAGDLTLGNGTAATDWNLASARAGGEAGVLTLRAGGNLNINSHLSDGFNVATPQSGSTPATLLADDSWSYRLVAGADSLAADPLAVKPGDTSVTLAAGKLIRTGTGDIRIASGKDIRLANNLSAIYTAGRLAVPQAGFTVPTSSVNFAQFSEGGGNVNLRALGDITSEFRSRQLYSNWLFRQGRLNADETAYTVQPAWWVRFDQFQQGVGALGGGDVTFTAGGQVKNISASTPTQAYQTALVPDDSTLVKTGGGDVRVETGGDVLGGQYYADNGELVIRAGGQLAGGEAVGSRTLYTILALGDAQAKVRANGELNLHAVINPHLVVQTSGAGSNVNIASATSLLNSLFSTYGEASAVSLESLSGKLNFHNAPGGASVTQATPVALATLLINNSIGSSAYAAPLSFTIGSYNGVRAFGLLPSSLNLTAYQSDILFGGLASNMRPAANGELNLLAAGSVNLLARLNMLDMAPLPDAIRPVTLAGGAAFSPSTTTAHAATPVHLNDLMPVRVYATTGDVTGNAVAASLTLPKAFLVKAGRDVRNLGINAQHVNPDNSISRIEAGRDVVFAGGVATSRQNLSVRLGGPGRLEVTAGRNVDLGTSEGLASRGNLENPALPEGGASIHVAAGVGLNGIDYQAAVDRLILQLSAGSDATGLSLARWLTGDNTLQASDALDAVQAIKLQDSEIQRTRVRDLVYTALRETGRDFNNPDSEFGGDYSRGYAALELLFPGVREKNADGSFKSYQGSIDLFASRILIERGGSIELLAPGGDVIAGLANTAEALLQTTEGVLGIATVGAGDIKGFARDDILVNQSRILTVGGGDVLLWSSEGDIDAGRGKRSVTVVPPPVTLIDAQGNVSLVLQGAASGSGIGALQPDGGIAGDVDLVAPLGTVNAGDAGIRAGNLNIAAQVVLGADNISVTGTSTGTPVADTSAVSAASSGASNAGGDVSSATASLANSLSEAAAAAEKLKDALKLTFISAEVIGHGE